MPIAARGRHPRPCDTPLSCSWHERDRCHRHRRRGAPGRGRISPALATSARRSFAVAVDDVNERQVADRDAAVTAALQQVDVLNRSQLDAGDPAACRRRLAASKDVIGSQPRRSAQRDPQRARPPRRAGRQPSATPAPSASARSTPRCAAHAEVAARARRLHRSRCARRWPTRRPAASGASGWPRTCCAWPASPRHVNYRKQAPAAGVAGGGGAGAPTSRSTCPRATSCYMDVKFPLAVVPALPRGRHRRRARPSTSSAFLRDVRAGSRSWPSATTSEGDQAVGRLRAAVPAQRAAHRVHPRARPGAARRRPRPAGRDVLAAHAVRLPRRHPPGVRQLRGRADAATRSSRWSASSAQQWRKYTDVRPRR